MYTTAVTEGLEMGDKRERPALISTNPVDSIFGTRPFRLRPFFGSWAKMLPTVTLVKQLRPRSFEGLTPTEIAYNHRASGPTFLPSTVGNVTRRVCRQQFLYGAPWACARLLHDPAK